MNWTGGGLSRHARNAKGDITAKQKQHFAKVRSAQQGITPKMSPVKWSVFNQIAGASRDPRQAEAKSSEGPRRVYNRREAVDVVLDGLAEDSAGQKERDSKRPYASSRELSAHARPPGLEEIRMIKRESGRADELRDASRRSKLQPKRKFEAEISQADDVQHGQSTMEKRRKMLSKGDWVGVTFQKPPDLKYRSPEKIDQIGKRRKVSRGHRARYEQRRRETPPALMRQLPQKDSYETKPRHADVRISIGGREVRVGVSSSSGLGVAPPDHVNKTAGTVSSEIMLLDCEEADGQQLPRKHDSRSDTRLTSLIESGRNLPIDANPHGFQFSPSVIILDEHAENPHIATDMPSRDPETGGESRPSFSPRGSHVRSHAKTRNLSSNHSERTLTTPELRRLYHNFLDRPDDTFASEAAVEGQDEFSGQGSPNPLFQRSEMGLDELLHEPERKSTAASSNRSTLLSFGDAHETTGHSGLEPRLVSILSSEPRKPDSVSPLLIQHPVPQSSRTSQLLWSDDSDAGVSMLVQTGKVEPLSKQGENLDEEAWRSWVLPEHDSLDQRRAWEVSESDQVLLTPGIRMYDVRSKQVLRPKSVSAEARSEDLIEQHYPIEGGIDEAGSITNVNQSTLQLHTEIEHYLRSESAESRAYTEENGGKESSTRPFPTSVPNPNNPEIILDENDQWQRFVFTSDSDGEESTTEQQPNLKRPLSVPGAHSDDSSLLVHPSFETDEPLQKSRTSASQLEYKEISEVQQLLTEMSSYDLEMDERLSPGATQATPVEFSPSASEIYQKESYDGQTTHATQGSYRSSPDILSTGSPLLGSYSRRNLTASQNGTERLTQSETKRKVVFRKPKPFIGKDSTGSKAMKKPLRIGKKFVVKNGTKGESRAKNMEGEKERDVEGRDIYDMTSEDDVESIEDY